MDEIGMIEELRISIFEKYKQLALEFREHTKLAIIFSPAGLCECRAEKYADRYLCVNTMQPEQTFMGIPYLVDANQSEPFKITEA